MNVAGLTADDITPLKSLGETLGLGFHLAALIVLVFAYREFWAKVRSGALFKAAAVLVTGWAIGILLSWGLVEMFPRTLAEDDRLFYVVNRVVGFAVVDPSSFSGRPHVFLNALFGLFSAMALIAAAIVLFQSQRADNALTGEDESAIRGLLELYGKNDSLGYFATRRDKSVVFAPSGRAAITYRVEVGVCLASGDPIGDPRAWPQAIDAWLALCQTYGWAPGNMGASSAGAKAFREAGLNALELGDEAILYTADFRLSGREMRGVRQAVTRARRAELTVRIRRHYDIEAAEMAKVIARADAWRDTESERGFSMALGRLGDPADGDCLLVEAVAPDDTVVAMLSLVPWGRNGVSLDLMRRSPESPNGTIELMVTELALHAERIGISRISLNFAMFRSAFEQGAQFGAGPVARLWRGFLVFFSRWWQLETLYRSNMKYQPDWVPRYACYEDARLIPRVGVASVIAEGFLVLPFTRRNEQHTGHHSAVPATLLATGLLHHDGSAPDVSALQQTDLGGGDDGDRRLPEQMRVRLSKLKMLQNSGIDAYPVGQPPSHTIAQALGSDEPGDGLGVGTRAADPGLRRCAVRPIARLVRRSATAAGEFGSGTRAHRGFHQGHRSRRPGRSDRRDGIQQDRDPVTDRSQLATDRQVLAAAAQQVEGADRSGSASAQPLRRPGCQRRIARTDRGPQQCAARHQRNPERQGLSGSRDPDPATNSRRCHGPPVHHPHQQL